MIILISEKADIMTDLVAEYLAASGCAWQRLDDRSFHPDSTRIASDGEVDIEKLGKATAIWNRRGAPCYFPDELRARFTDREAILTYLGSEIQVLQFFHEKLLKEKLGDRFIGSLSAEHHNNKLSNLLYASASGLTVPRSAICTTKASLLAFLADGKAISKDIKAPANIRTREGSYHAAPVGIIEAKDIEELGNQFAPLFVQQYIDKAFELRCFVYGSAIFSMAIFSQNDEQTAVDFRNYNTARPSRCVPFNLPECLRDKLLSFMELAQLNTGSIDLIYTPAGEYVFLEVNPMGQFHWLSENCNYHLESFIANYLTHA